MSAAAPALGVVTIAGADAERSKRGGLSREAKGIISAAFQGRDRGASKLAALLKGPAAKEVDAALPQTNATALHRAGMKGNIKCWALLLQAGWSLQACDQFERTPLHCAAKVPQAHQLLAIALKERGAMALQACAIRDSKQLTPIATALTHCAEQVRLSAGEGLGSAAALLQPLPTLLSTYVRALMQGGHDLVLLHNEAAVEGNLTPMGRFVLPARTEPEDPEAASSFRSSAIEEPAVPLGLVYGKAMRLGVRHLLTVLQVEAVSGFKVPLCRAARPPGNGCPATPSTHDTSFYIDGSSTKGTVFDCLAQYLHAVPWLHRRSLVLLRNATKG